MRIGSRLKGHSPGFIIFFIFLLTAVFACKSDMAIEGFDPDNGFDEDDIGAVRKTTIDTLALNFTFADTALSTGRGFLCLGELESVKTQVLLKFASIPDTVDILEATLVLRTNSINGPKSRLFFDASLYPVTAAWQEDTLTVERFGDAYDMVELGRSSIASVFRVDSSNVEIVRFDLNDTGVNVVRQWADTTAGLENNGLLIEPLGSGFIKVFHSREASISRAAQLELRVDDNGVLDTLFVPVSMDGYLARKTDSQATFPDGPLYVDHLFGNQSIIKFDFSEIPRESTINRAEMVLSIDSEHSSFNDNSFLIQFVRLDDRVTTPDSLVVASLPVTVNSSSVPPVREGTESIRISVRGFVQGWVNEIVDNNGFLLRTSFPGLDVSRVAIFGGDSEPALRPRLEIDYTVPPTIL